MKNFLSSVLLSFMAFASFAQTAQPGLIKPDLIGNVEKVGNMLNITIYNEPINPEGLGTGIARISKATLSIAGQVQTLSVPELKPNEKFEKSIAVPTNLQNQVFTVILKVNSSNVVLEPSDNNTFTAIFNQPDLTPVSDTHGDLIVRQEGDVLYFNVKNIGGTSSAPCKAKFITYLTSGGTKVVTLDIPSLSPLARAILLKVEYFDAIHYELRIDINNQVKEADEDNNIAHRYYEE